ncbi:hypothetical protein MTO96_009448 [Rhipicephalus appendiculatus]
MNRNNIVSLCYGCAALNSFSLLKYAFGFYRRSITYGWAFDLAFGSECFINLVSDYFLLAAYKDSLVLLGFIAWNTTSIAICFVTSIVLAVHFANTVDLKDAIQDLKEQNMDEADFRRQMMITTISVFTFMAFLKGAILYNIYMYYKKTDGTDGSDEEPPTAFYFPADPTAPVPFLPPESKRQKANAAGAPPAAARCGLTGGARHSDGIGQARSGACCGATIGQEAPGAAALRSGCATDTFHGAPHATRRTADRTASDDAATASPTAAHGAGGREGRSIDMPRGTVVGKLK